MLKTILRNMASKTSSSISKFTVRKVSWQCSKRAEESHSDELLIIIEAVAETQEIANTICSFARSTMLHFGYEGRYSTSGNLAFPFSPSDCKMGEVYEFNIYHLLEVDDPTSLFPIEYMNFEKGECK